MSPRGAVILAALTISTPLPVSAQVALGARHGHGVGSSSYTIGELYARVRAAGPVHVGAAFEILGGNWSCAAGPTTALLCGYDGRSVTVGPGVALVDTHRFRVAGRGAVGWFERTGTYGGREYTGSDHVTVILGLDGEVAVVGPLRLEAGVTHRRIFDEEYEEVAGELPHVTALVVGVGWVFGRCRDGG